MTLVSTEPKKIYLCMDVTPITTSGIYHNSNLWLISLSSDGSNWITIADKNLWATSTDITSTDSYWNYYQWWNNHWFSYAEAIWGTITTSSTQVNASNYWPWSYYNSSTFITSWSALKGRWDTSNNSNLWWGTTWTNDAMKWPCPEWFHIPSMSEWIAVFGMLNTTMWITPNNIRTYLKYPQSWFIWYDWWTSPSYTTNAYMRYSTRKWNESWYYYSYNTSFLPASNYIDYQDYTYNTYWLPIRPFKNEAVQPRVWEWTKLN